MSGNDVPVGLTRRGSGPPLVLLHGIGDTRATWAPVLDALATRYQVFALDLPGFGDAPALSDTSHPHDIAVAVAARMDALGLDRAAMVGSSLGGWVALELAALGRAESVLCLSPAGFWSERDRRWVRGRLHLFRWMAHLFVPPATGRPRPRLTWMFGSRVMRTALTSMMVARPWAMPTERARDGVTALSVSEGWDATLAAMTGDRYAPPADGLDVPVTIAWAAKDRLLPPHQRHVARELLPQARVGLLPGCGHLPMWDDPELVVRAVHAGVSSSSGPPRPGGPARS